MSNQTIQELVERAGGFKCSDDEWGFYDQDLAAFAELLIRTCADIALREDHDPAECILRYFGLSSFGDTK